jgi:hypothetical protein
MEDADAPGALFPGAFSAGPQAASGLVGASALLATAIPSIVGSGSWAGPAASAEANPPVVRTGPLRWGRPGSRRSATAPWISYAPYVAVALMWFVPDRRVHSLVAAARP